MSGWIYLYCFIYTGSKWQHEYALLCFNCDVSDSSKSNRHNQIKEDDWKSQSAIWRYANTVMSAGVKHKLVYITL